MKSVGEYTQPENSVKSVNSVGRYDCSVGAAETAAPPENSIRNPVLMFSASESVVKNLVGCVESTTD